MRAAGSGEKKATLNRGGGGSFGRGRDSRRARNYDYAFSPVPNEMIVLFLGKNYFLLRSTQKDVFIAWMNKSDPFLA
jgi:hypothetical protein